MRILQDDVYVYPKGHDVGKEICLSLICVCVMVNFWWVLLGICIPQPGGFLRLSLCPGLNHLYLILPLIFCTVLKHNQNHQDISPIRFQSISCTCFTMTVTPSCTIDLKLPLEWAIPFQQWAMQHHFKIMLNKLLFFEKWTLSGTTLDLNIGNCCT